MRRDAAAGSADREAEQRAWIKALKGGGGDREQAVARLHALLVRAARFELSRRGATLTDTRGGSLEDLVTECADDALVAILGKLEHYRFESRFTTWAYKFAILEAAVRARRRAWQERELPADPQAWSTLPVGALNPATSLASRERLRAAMTAIKTELTAHQREVLTALVLADVPIDVLAERLNTTRGALYKTLHDARRTLRAAVPPDHDD